MDLSEVNDVRYVVCTEEDNPAEWVSMVKDATLGGRGNWSLAAMEKEKRDSLCDPNSPRS